MCDANTVKTIKTTWTSNPANSDLLDSASDSDLVITGTGAALSGAITFTVTAIYVGEELLQPFDQELIAELVDGLRCAAWVYAIIPMHVNVSAE